MADTLPTSLRMRTLPTSLRMRSTSVVQCGLMIHVCVVLTQPWSKKPYNFTKENTEHL